MTEINSNYLIITIISPLADPVSHKLVKLITSCNCTIIKSRVTNMGADFVGNIFLQGNWNAIAKLEVMLINFEKKMKAKIYCKRTHTIDFEEPYLHYQISAVTALDAKILTEVTQFFHKKKINVAEMKTDTSYNNNIKLLSLTIIIKVNLTIHIPTLREDFFTLCDELNLDAGFDTLVDVQ